MASTFDDEIWNLHPARNDRHIREMKPGWFSARPQLLDVAEPAGPGFLMMHPSPWLFFVAGATCASAYVPLGVSRNGARSSAYLSVSAPPELARSSTIVANAIPSDGSFQDSLPKQVCAMARASCRSGVAVLSLYTP